MDNPVKRRRRTTKHEQAILEELYAESRTPSLESRLRVCQAIGFEMRALCIWLQNRRQKEKKDAGKWKPSYTATGELQAGNITKPSSTATSSYTSSNASHTRTSSPAVSSLALYHQRAASTSSSEQDELADELADEGEQAHADAHTVYSHTPAYSASSLQASESATPSMHLAINKQTSESRDHHYTRKSLPLASSSVTSSLTSTNAGTSMTTSTTAHGYAAAVELPVRALVPKRVVSQQQQAPQCQQTQDHALRESSVDAEGEISSSDDISESMVDASSTETRSSSHQFGVALHANAAAKQTSNAAPPPTATTVHAAQPLRRTTSSYSLCIASDGKATMTAMPVVPVQEAHQASSTGTTTAIPASADVNVPSRGPAHGHGHVQSGRPIQRLPSLSAMLSGQLSSFSTSPPSSSSGPAFSTAPAPGFCLSPSKQSQAARPSRFARVQSQPCLSGVSSSVSSARRGLANPQARPSIFSSSTSAAAAARGPSSSNSNPNANHSHTRVVKAELWDKLDSDPLEPEDEIASSRTRRALASPVRRLGAITMEDILSTSRKSQRRQLQHPYARTQTQSQPQSQQTQQGQELQKNHHYARDLSASASPEKARPPRAEISGPAPVARSLGPRFGDQKREQQPISQMLALRGRASAISTSVPASTTMSSNARPPLLHRSNTAPDALFSRANTLARPHDNVHHTVENMGPSLAQAVSAGSVPLCSQTRKRGYSRSMLVRTVSLDRVMLLDDSADEDDGHHSEALHTRPVKKARRSLPASTFNHVTATMSELGSSPSKSDAESRFSTAGNTSFGSAAMLVEPDLTFSSNEASLSFDALSSRGDISEVDTEVDGVDIQNDTDNDRVRRMTSSSQKKRTSTAASSIFSAPPSARTILSPASRSTAAPTATVAAAATQYHALAPNSPCKSGNLNGITWINGSPTKNGKILTDMERDCAAVLMGLVGGGGE